MTPELARVYQSEKELKEELIKTMRCYEDLRILYGRAMSKLARIVDYAVEHEDKELLMFMSGIRISQ
jgi:hypothetical protein